ncbi:MAG: hypothetical protein AAGF92_03305 [Myxococcota bacterium]
MNAATPKPRDGFFAQVESLLFQILHDALTVRRARLASELSALKQ